ncbi:hypothetical protein U1872_06180 [Sphingomonas sp. RB3P16]|uniref:hypothetical protein n=1 Tax=Parasphingomonas frigoris TaxID=3096163 RepID=UPI002FC66C78
MSDLRNALAEMIAPMPRTETRELAMAPTVRKAACGKCPFAGYALTASELAQADLIKARISGERSAGKLSTVWGCHETVRGQRPQICAGFVDYIRDRPEIA